MLAYGNFAAFGAVPRPGEFRAGDEWDQWCASAADVWERVSGNPAEAAALLGRCVKCNVEGLSCHYGQAPWTSAGHLSRDLPAHFSTSEDITRKGVLGSVAAAAATGVKAAEKAFGPRPLVEELENCIRVGSEFGAFDRIDRRSDEPPDVADRHADPLLAGIEAKQRPSLGKRGGELGDVEHGQSAAICAQGRQGVNPPAPNP